MAAQHLTTTSKNPMNPPPKRSPPPSTSIEDDILSPGFRSVAAMAGWDEEALISAALVVDDTPLRDSRRKKRRQFISPPSTLPHKNLRRSREAAPRAVLHLDDSDDEEEADDKNEISEKGKGEGGGKELACLDRLREELSCAICLDICFEPSTTNCGHSFCKTCLNCAAAKCGKRCPKCRQLISYTRDCSINTVLWNTIQLLFPEEVEERKMLMPTTASCTESRNRSPRNNARRSTRVPRETEDYRVGRTAGPSQSEDAALALRLQREEFMDGFRDNHRSQRLALQARLNAIAARANYIRSRDRH